MSAVVAVAGMGVQLPGFPNLAAWQTRTAQPEVIRLSRGFHRGGGFHPRSSFP